MRRPSDIVEPVLAGPGRDQCIRFFAASIREIQRLDSRLLAVIDIPSKNRFRVFGGIFSACSPYLGMLDVSIDSRASVSLVEEVVRLGGGVTEDRNPRGALPFTMCISVPPSDINAVWEPLWRAHREHLLECIDYGRPSTHQHRDRPDLRDYLLHEANKLASQGR